MGTGQVNKTYLEVRGSSRGLKEQEQCADGVLEC